jgi:hypothetical protein
MLILPIAHMGVSIPGGFVILGLLVLAAWFAATVYGSVGLIKGMRGRDKADTRRGAIWLFTPYVCLALLALLFGGVEMLRDFVVSYVTGVYVAIVLVAFLVKGMSSPPPGPPDGSRNDGYNEPRRML